MANMGWGLVMMLLGMGIVFLMLIALMVVLMIVGRPGKDKTVVPADEAPPQPVKADEPAEDNAWMTIADGSGLTPEQIAAVSVACAVHANVLRKQGALANRTYAPGTHLWASRWVAMGRDSQMKNQRR